MATLDQQIRCAKEELERRKGRMAWLVEQGKLSEERATHEIECMRAIYQTLSQLKGILAG